MSTVTSRAGAMRPTPSRATTGAREGIPLARIASTELRKMFDTRSGFWLMVGIAALALVTTSMVIAFAPRAELTYRTFATAIGVPMTVLLPVVAILSVTSEWSQRSGLTTFALVPHRHRVIAGKALACGFVAIVSIPFAFAVGAVGNLVGTAIAGVPTVWDMTVTDLLAVVLANVLAMTVGFMLGVVIRASAGAIAAYLVYAFVLPSLAMLLAMSQQWFADLRPWVDFDHARNALIEGTLGTEQWVHLGVTGVIWLVVPLVVGLVGVVRAEVK